MGLGLKKAMSWNNLIKKPFEGRFGGASQPIGQNFAMRFVKQDTANDEEAEFVERSKPRTDVFYHMNGAKIGWRHMEGDKGRGVFALADIAEGEIIETAPVIIVSKDSIPDNGEPPDGYVLDWDPEVEGEEHALVMGYVMLYNHSETASNVSLENDYDQNAVTVTAARDIRKGEELCWNYSCDIWFDTEDE